MPPPVKLPECWGHRGVSGSIAGGFAVCRARPWTWTARTTFAPCNTLEGTRRPAVSPRSPFMQYGGKRIPTVHRNGGVRYHVPCAAR